LPGEMVLSSNCTRGQKLNTLKSRIHIPSTNKVACVVRKAVWEGRWVALDDGGELRKDVCVRLWWVWVCAHGDFDDR
jgi:hypothetical protein